MMRKERNGLVVTAMVLGLLMASLDNTITSAAINQIIKDIGGFERMSWVFTGYVLAATSTMLVFGKLSDLFGRKRFYLIGIGAFLFGSALCGMAGSMEQLIFFRFIQGIGAGSLFPISFTIIFTIFSGEKAAKMSGIFAGIFGLSSVAGPQIGTFISEQLSWRWCFYVNLPIGILSFIILLFALKESRSNKKVVIDYLGTVLLIVTTISFMLGLEWGGKEYVWTSWQILSLFITSLICGTLFIVIEKKAEEPILPLELFKKRLVLSTSIACLCQGAIMFAAITYLPIFSVAVLGQANSNSMLTPLMFSLMLGAVFAGGFLINRLSFRTIMVTSMFSGIVATYLLSTLPHDASELHMISLMVLLGLGAIGPLMSVAQNAVASCVDRKYLGVLSSVVGFWRNIGGILGASLMATIVNHRLEDLIEEGARARHLSMGQFTKYANPEAFIQASAFIPKDVQLFLRDSLGTAINNGFILSIIFASIGLVAALFAGPGRYLKKVSE